MNLLQRIVARIRRELSGFGSLTPAERSFLPANRRYWSRLLSDNAPEGSGYVLVEPVFHPLMLLENTNMAATIAVERNLTPLFLVANPLARRLRRILQSYPRSKADYVVDFRGDLVRLVTTLVQAWRVYRTLHTPDEILTLAIDGLTYGDLVYDTVLQMGYATVDRVDRRTLRQLWAFFYYRSKIIDLMSRYRIVAAAFAGRQGTEAGTITRYLLQRRVEIVLRSGAVIFAATKYRTSADSRVFEFRPDKRYVDLMIRRKGDFLPPAEEYLRQRLAHEVDPTNDNMAFDQRKRLFRSRQEFASVHSLDPDKPIVFVMIHVFNDHPHYLDRLLFRDYYQWFQRTLDVAATVHSVNWVFKEHPAAIYYDTGDVNSDSLAEQVRSRSLTFLSATSDFNAASLPAVAHAIVTCIGTAGLEYVALGVPCLLAGDSPYSGFGITVEPSTANEYFEALRQIDRLARPTDEQRTTAKLVAYLYLHALFEPRDPFFKLYLLEEVMRGSNDVVFRDNAEILNERNYAVLDEQVRIVREFLRRSDFTQYVDFQRFPLLRAALDGST